MLPRISLCAVLASILAPWQMLSFSASVLAQDTSSAIIGVWKVTTVETREVVSGKITRPFGEKPTGTFVFTQGGHMTGMQFASNRTPAAGPNATEAERAALFSSMTAYSGTYRLDGNKLIIRFVFELVGRFEISSDARHCIQRRVLRR